MGEAFLRDHLLPLGSSIWSASLREMHEYPLAAFVRFFRNHGLLEARMGKQLPDPPATGDPEQAQLAVTHPT